MPMAGTDCSLSLIAFAIGNLPAPPAARIVDLAYFILTIDTLNMFL